MRRTDIVTNQPDTSVHRLHSAKRNLVGKATIMLSSKAVFSVFALLCVVEAFVPQQSLATRLVQQKQMNLNALDPAHILDSASAILSSANAIPGTSGEVSYSRASYYTILGLYVISFPGILSTVKRSTKAKVKKKTYVT